MSFISRMFGGSSRSNMPVQTFRQSPAYERKMPINSPRDIKGYNPDLFWTDPAEQFELLESRRDSLHSIQKLIVDNVAPRLPDRGIILEIGSGIGFLREMVGDNVSKNVTWIESDKTPTVVSPARSFKTDYTMIKLPEKIEAPDSSMSAVVGSGVLDTLPYGDMPAVMSEIFRILKPGGLLLHFLDIWPCRYPEAEWAANNGMALFPFLSTHQETGQFFAGGFYYLKREMLAQIRDGLSDEIGSFVENLLNDPLNASLNIENKGDCDDMIDASNLFKEKGCVVDAVQDFPVLFGKVLASFAISAGFSVEHYGEIISPFMGIPRSTYPFLPFHKNVLAKIHGLMFKSENDELRKAHPNMVFNLCGGQLLAARKKGG